MFLNFIKIPSKMGDHPSGQTGMVISEIIYSSLDQELNQDNSDIIPDTWHLLCSTYAFWACNYALSSNQSLGELSTIHNHMVNLDSHIKSREDASDYTPLSDFIYPGFTVESLGRHFSGLQGWATDRATISHALLSDAIGHFESAIELLEDFVSDDAHTDKDILDAIDAASIGCNRTVNFRDNKPPVNFIEG